MKRTKKLLGKKMLAAWSLFLVTALVAALVVPLMAGGAGAQAPASNPPAEAAGPPQVIHYQGILLDPGTGDPVPDGDYEFTFSIYDVETGGTLLVSETQTVPVEGGAFSALIGSVTPIPASIFSGHPRYLGIKVGADPEMTPRQLLASVPYALYAGGADLLGGLGVGDFVHVSGDTMAATHGGYVLTVKNEGVGHAIYASARDSGDVTNYGGYFSALGTTGIGVVGAATGDNGIGIKASGGPNGLAALFEGDVHVTGDLTGADSLARDSEIMPAVLASDGPGSTLNADLLDGLDSSEFLSTATDYGRSGVAPSLYEGTTTLTAKYVNASGDTMAATHSGYVLTVKNEGVGHAIYATAQDSGDVSNRGGYFSALGTTGIGVVGAATGDNGIGIKASGGPNGLAALFLGNVRISNRAGTKTLIELGDGLDYAEGFDVSSENGIEPGAVLIIDPDNPGKLTLSNRAYDTRVAGIIAGASGLGSGVRLGSDEFDCDVALAGRVYCNVDAAGGDIEPGDLLTTSGTPGYAMKVTDHARAQGAILGKAMERLEKGHKGQILVLVALQ